MANGEVVIDGDGSGDIVEITAPDVTFRGFVIRNTGIDLDKENAAIRVLAPRACHPRTTSLDDVLFGIDLREAPDSRVCRQPHRRQGAWTSHAAATGCGSGARTAR